MDMDSLKTLGKVIGVVIATVSITWTLINFFQIRDLEREIESQKELINRLEAKVTKYEDWLVQYDIIKKIDGMWYKRKVEEKEELKSHSNTKNTSKPANNTSTKTITWMPVQEPPPKTTIPSPEKTPELPSQDTKVIQTQEGKMIIKVWPKTKKVP